MTYKMETATAAFELALRALAKLKSNRTVTDRQTACRQALATRADKQQFYFSPDFELMCTPMILPVCTHTLQCVAPVGEQMIDASCRARHLSIAYISSSLISLERSEGLMRVS